MNMLKIINMGPQFEANAKYRSKIMGYTHGCKCPECGFLDNLPVNHFDFGFSYCPKCKTELEDPAYKKENSDQKYWIRANVKWKPGLFGRGKWVETTESPIIETDEQYKKYYKDLEKKVG